MNKRAGIAVGFLLAMLIDGQAPHPDVPGSGEADAVYHKLLG